MRQCCHIKSLLALLLWTAAVAAQAGAGRAAEPTGSLVIQSAYSTVGFDLPGLALADTCYPGERHVYAEVPPGVFDISLWDISDRVQCELAIHAGQICYLVVGTEPGRSTVNYIDGTLTQPLTGHSLVTRILPDACDGWRFWVRIPSALAVVTDAALYDSPPEMIRQGLVERSEEAVRAGLLCDITMLVLVEPDGTVSRVHPLIDVPFLQSAVAKVTSELFFTPAMRGGEPAAAWVFSAVGFEERVLWPDVSLSCRRAFKKGPAN